MELRERRPRDANQRWCGRGPRLRFFLRSVGVFFFFFEDVVILFTPQLSVGTFQPGFKTWPLIKRKHDYFTIYITLSAIWMHARTSTYMSSALHHSSQSPVCHRGPPRPDSDRRINIQTRCASFASRLSIHIFSIIPNSIHHHVALN